MFVRIVGVAVVCGLLAVPATVRAENGENAAAAGAFVGGVLTGGFPVERREPAREYIYRDRERPRSYLYSGNLEVGQRFDYGPRGSRELPREYGAEGYHYDVVNRRAVIFHPHTRQIIHVYDANDDD